MVLATKSRERKKNSSQTIKIYTSGQTGMFELIIVHFKTKTYNITKMFPVIQAMCPSSATFQKKSKLLQKARTIPSVREKSIEF